MAEKSRDPLATDPLNRTWGSYSTAILYVVACYGILVMMWYCQYDTYHNMYWTSFFLYPFGSFVLTLQAHYLSVKREDTVPETRSAST